MYSSMPINNQSLVMTYSPYKNAVYNDDISALSLNNPGIDIALAKSYLAALRRNLTKPYSTLSPQYEASDPKGSYKRTGMKIAGANYKLQFGANLNRQLVHLVKKNQVEQKFYASINDDKYDPMAAIEMAQLNASAPPGTGDSATGKVSPITQIPFIQDVLGVPNEQYFISELFTKVALPQLHAEIPETDWMAPLLQLRPTQKLDFTELDFDSHFFDAKRNEVPYVLPREYRYRATIDPLNLYSDAAARALREAREALALLALSGLTAGTDTLNPTTESTAGFPAGLNNIKAQWEGLFADHWKNYRVLIDSCVINPVDFVNYESNFFTKGFAPYSDVEIWGLVNLPGFKRPIRTAISPFCPQNQIYFFNSRYAFLGEGPQITETWPKPEINSDAGTWRDYVDEVIFNPLRAGFKTKIASSSPTEITTLKAARDLVKPNTSGTKSILAKNQ